MDEQSKPVLKKPPGYRDPNSQAYAPPRPPRPPARKPVLPLYIHPRKQRRRHCRSCCYYVCVFILLLLLAAAVAGCFFYVWYEPRLPVFYLQSLKFHRFNITAGSDGPALNSQAVVRIEVRNPNGALKVKYGKTVVNLNGGGVDLGSASSPEFTQGKKKTTVLKFKTQVKNVLLESRVATKLKSGFRAKSLVVRMEVRTGIGVDAGWWRTMTPAVKVRCDGLSLKQVDRGDVPKCKIYIFKWFKL